MVLGIPFLAPIALQLAVPLSLPYGFLGPDSIPGGGALAIVGAVLVVPARRELGQRGKPTAPGHRTNSVVTTGVFSVSRNDIYMRAVCLLSGISLAANLPWVLEFLIPALVASQYVLMAQEKRYLASRSGE